jgi:hypothetical protein
MSKRVIKVRYRLIPCKEYLSQDEINIIIRAAENIVFQGGRSLLAKILKGSKDKKIKDHRLEKNPSYGAFNNDTIETITSKIDWMKVNVYLDIEYE